jgi:hypothetical protein
MKYFQFTLIFIIGLFHTFKLQKERQIIVKIFPKIKLKKFIASD